MNYNDKEYPEPLKSIKDPPKTLFWRGSYNVKIFENCLAVVGSRKMSPYGEKVIDKIFTDLNPGITIVSGFMYGVDTKAHSEAIRSNLKTVAVLPCGLDFQYPRSNALLYQEILKSGGLILSEYKGSVGPRTWSYLRRNRIVAGLSRCLLVVEASEKSGSLNTAGLMREYGRTVAAVPGNIFSELSSGCLSIMKTYAKAVSCGSEVNSLMGFDQNVLFNGLVDGEECILAKEDVLIVQTLKAYPLTLSDLSTYLSIPVNILSSKITQLCLNGVLFESYGRFYAR